MPELPEAVRSVRPQGGRFWIVSAIHAADTVKNQDMKIHVQGLW
jgi:hypothetical protein